MSLRTQVIEDLRYNPYTETFSNYGYGKAGNAKEVHTVPSTSPYWIYLNEIPQQNTPSSVAINEQGGGSFTEVSITTSPASGQFRVVYGGDGSSTTVVAGQGIIEFNSADAGTVVEVEYYGLGTILQQSLIDALNKKGLELTDYTDSATIALASGRSEEVDGKMIIVDSADFTITDSGIADGVVYVHLLPSDNGTATCYISASAGTWDDSKGGYYDSGAKVIFAMNKLDSVYYNKRRMTSEAPLYLPGGIYTDDYLMKFSQIGNGLSIATLGYPTICALSATRIVIYDDATNDIITYDWDGTDWAAVGNPKDIAGTDDPCITALSSNTIAITDQGNDWLRTYSFDGTDWDIVGNSKPLTSITHPTICALSATRIAYYDSDDDELRVYDWDGTDWTETGADALAGGDYASITTLNSTTIAFIDNTIQELRTYVWDGSNWATSGNALTIPEDIGIVRATSLSSSRIAVLDSTSKKLRIYDWDGTDWSEKRDYLYFPEHTGNPGLCALSSSRVVVIDDVEDILKTFDLYRVPVIKELAVDNPTVTL